jgi:hypothetical protein
MGFRAAAPAPDMGYNRTTDWPSAGAPGASPAPAGGSMFGLKNKVPGAPGAWHPTVLWLVGLVLVEMLAFHTLNRHLKL